MLICIVVVDNKVAKILKGFGIWAGNLLRFSQNSFWGRLVNEKDKTYICNPIGEVGEWLKPPVC